MGQGGSSGDGGGGGYSCSPDGIVSYDTSINSDGSYDRTCSHGGIGFSSTTSYDNTGNATSITTDFCGLNLGTHTFDNSSSGSHGSSSSGSHGSSSSGSHGASSSGSHGASSSGSHGASSSGSNGSSSSSSHGSSFDNSNNDAYFGWAFDESNCNNSYSRDHYWDFYGSLYWEEFRHLKCDLETHWNYHGKHEGRLQHKPKGFKWEVYLAMNPDLHCLKMHIYDHGNYRFWSLMRHYADSGRFEGRKYFPENFDITTYKHYIDLSHYSDVDLVLHWINHGKSEGRLGMLPCGFNPKIYKAINKDLSNHSDEEAIGHYVNWGRNENRSFYPENFDIITYKYYIDLSHFSDVDLVLHWINHGKSEGRLGMLPKGFDSKIYKAINNDLSNHSDEDAIGHYVNWGRNENRSFC
jgi:hypothetical protein